MTKTFPKFSILIVITLTLAIPIISRGDQVQDGPRFNLFGGASTSHPFTSLPHVVGPVIVEVRAKADLGCDGWDYTNCNSGSNLCAVAPTSKWVNVAIAGNTIEGTDGFVGVPNPGDPPVPTDGHFFGCWNFENPATPECGFSDCAGQPQLTNVHRFTITESQWNAWLGAGTSLSVIVTSRSVMKNLPTYCSQDANGTNCCGAGDPAGDCSNRPASNATIIITYTSVPTGSCCIPATATCSLTSQAACNALCGVWTQSGACSPNPCSVQPMGACCFRSGW